MMLEPLAHSLATGQMKTDGRLTRCPLKGTTGDVLFAVLCACGHKIRKIPGHLRALSALLIAAILGSAKLDNLAGHGFLPPSGAAAPVSVRRPSTGNV